MADQDDETLDDAGLTKPKKKRTEAQIAATERMRSALESKQMSSGKLSVDEKRLRLQAIKEQLNGPLKKDKAKISAASVVSAAEESSDDELEPVPAPLKTKMIKKDMAKPIKEKKQPAVVYETDSESEEEVIVIKKKKKKPKKKTIIYEDATDSEEEAPVSRAEAKARDTKTQQNNSSKFKVSVPEVKPKGPVYYFA